MRKQIELNGCISFEVQCPRCGYVGKLHFANQKAILEVKGIECPQCGLVVEVVVREFDNLDSDGEPMAMMIKRDAVDTVTTNLRAKQKNLN